MKFFSINRRHGPLLITLLVIISLGFIYLFIYIPRHEKIIREQRFLVLQSIDENIHEKIRNSVALLKNLLSAYQYPEGENRNFNKTVLDNYVKNISGNFDIVPHTIIYRSNIDSAKNIDSLDNVYSLEINNKTQQIVLRYSKKYSDHDQGIIAHSIGMKFTFEQFISSILPKNIFDEYIIFSKGKTVYQTFPAGVSYVKDDSLLGIKNGMSASSIRDFSISGKDYKLFLQPVQFTADTEWVIGGLLSDRRYQVERKQLPFRVILLLMTLAVCLFVAAPWIKLFHMGSKDRLTVLDGCFSILVSMLLVSILFLTFFKYNLPFRLDSSPDSKKILADKITLAFKKEIDSLTKKLYKYNFILKNNPSLSQDIIYNGRSFTFFDGTSIGKSDTLFKDLPRDSDSYLSVNHLFWLNGKGTEIFKWTNDNSMPPHADYSPREYFKNIRDKNTFSLNRINGENAIQFYIDQVMSWSSGSFASVISIPHGKNSDTVAAISFNAKSLSNTILPAGYQFAIINQQGDVLYHSQPSHNLNENLLEKFSASNILQSALNSHTEADFLTEYLSRKYNVKVQPLTDLPYFIVIFSDTGFKETRDLEIYSFTFTMIVLFFAFLIVEMSIIFFASARQSFFKKQLFDTSWVGPKRSAHGDYLLSTVFNLLGIILLIIFFLVPSFLTYGFMLLSSVSFLTLFLNLLYFIRYKIQRSNKYSFKLIAITFMTIMILALNFIAFKMLEPGHFGSLLIYQAVFILIGALIIYFRWRYLQANNFDKTNEAPGNDITTNRNNFFKNRKNYINSFTLMVITRLVITSGIPVVFFYIASYNYEQNLIIRYKLADYSNQLVNKLSPALSEKNKLIIEKPPVYIDSAWIKNVSLTKTPPGTNEYSKEDRISIKLLSGFRPDVTSEAVTEENFYHVNSSDSLFFFNPIIKNARTKDTGTVMYRKTNLPGAYLKLTSTGLKYNFPVLFYYKGALFWVFLFFSLGLFFFVLKEIIKKLFALKIPDLAKWEKMDENILADNKLNNLVFVLGSPGAKKKKYILEQISKGKLTSRKGEVLRYDEDLPWNSNVFIADLINIPDSDKNEQDNANWETYRESALADKNKLVIVNNFEYNIEDPVTNRIKLNFLEALMIRDTSKIIILSTIHPMAFLDSILLEKNKNGNLSISREDLDRWNILLGHFRIVLLGLEPFPQNEIVILLPKNKVDLTAEKEYEDVNSYLWSVVSGPALKDIIIATPDNKTTSVKNLSEGVYEFELKITNNTGNIFTETKIISVHKPLSKTETEEENNLYNLVCLETERTEFLNKMRPRAIDAAHSIVQYDHQNEQDLNADELAFKLQSTSHYFYMYIWQSLTKEEKFLLYDLAEDNLVNSFDSHNLSMLIGKGIIYRDKEGTLKIFNKGFRNFILTAIGNSEAMKLKDQIRDNGNWGKWKTPLIIIFIAILIFLMVSQEDAYTKLLAYVGALGAAIPIFLKLLSFFDRSPSKSS